jgi:hypothetical protein
MSAMSDVGRRRRTDVGPLELLDALGAPSSLPHLEKRGSGSGLSRASAAFQLPAPRRRLEIALRKAM